MSPRTFVWGDFSHVAQVRGSLRANHGFEEVADRGLDHFFGAALADMQAVDLPPLLVAVEVVEAPSEMPLASIRHAIVLVADGAFAMVLRLFSAAVAVEDLGWALFFPQHWPYSADDHRPNGTLAQAQLPVNNARSTPLVFEIW